MIRNIEDDERICEMYLQGLDTSTISKEINISDATVRRVLDMNNIIPRLAQQIKNYRKIIQEREKEICYMYTIKRMSTVEIGKVLGVYPNRIIQVLHKNNIKTRCQSDAMKIDISQEIKEKICNMYVQGMTPEKIANELNISRYVIPRILKENNIKIRGLHETTSKITHENEKEICEIYKKELLSISNLGKKFGISDGTIRKILNNNNIPFRPTGKVTIEGKKSIIKSNQRRCGELSSSFGRLPSKEHCFGKGSYYQSPLQGQIWIRSTWELQYAKFLDEHNILWTYETIAFPLILNGKKTTYRPDFYLVDYDIYIDVKGRKEWNADKINAFKQQYSDIKLQILFKEDLQNWGINVRKTYKINKKEKI